MTLDDLVRKVTSRKFLVALAAFISTQFGDYQWAGIAVAGIYLVIEGLIDAQAARKVPGDTYNIFDAEVAEHAKAQAPETGTDPGQYL